MRTPVFVLALVTCIAFASAAFAQMARHDPAELFARADSNHDGVVGRQEFLDARAARFDKLDRNHDGYLTDDDMPRFVRSDAGRMRKFHAVLQMADSDHDGTVSRDEFIAAGMRMFELVDTNHDNVIDRAEMKQVTERLRARTAGKGAP